MFLPFSLIDCLLVSGWTRVFDHTFVFVMDKLPNKVEKKDKFFAFYRPPPRGIKKTHYKNTSTSINLITVTDSGKRLSSSSLPLLFGSSEPKH